MNWIDLVLLFIILLSVWTGWQKGFILGITDLVSWVGSLLAGFFLYSYVANWIDQYITPLGVWSAPVAFILTILVARILLSLLFGPLLRRTSDNTHQSTGNKALGILPGAVNGVINATIIAALFLIVPMWQGVSEAAQRSKIANRLAMNVEWVDDKLSPVFDEAVNRSINRMTVHPDSKETVKLNFKVADPDPRADLEARMLELVNRERAKRGLKPLKADPELTAVARAHSKDMFAKGYFSHVNLEGQSPSDRIKAAHVRFLTAGENLAYAHTLTIAHTGLMNSPGHRANILHKDYGRVGIGIMDGGIYGLMVTQNFRN
ncbi:MAG TPA: CvpA family protein [Verrucomicrobiae bacterium]|nr:CvpA family protein [Verrucomicrobiae bacterium]